MTFCAGTPTRIAIAGDWHGDRGHARSAIAWASQQGATVILHLGDFGIWPGQPGKAYLDGVSQALTAARVTLGFVDGNHEAFPQLYAIPCEPHGARYLTANLWHLPRGYRWQWAGRTWLALGGATSLDAANRRWGIDWWPEEEITVADAEHAAAGGRADIMLTHDCPAGVDIPDLPPHSWWPDGAIAHANMHRSLLRRVVDAVQPAMLWHGHFHSAHQAVLTGDSYQCRITGLNDNHGPFHDNIRVYDLDPNGWPIPV